MTRTKACRSAYPYTRRRARPPRSPRRALNDDEGPHYDPSGDVFGRITADLEAGHEEELRSERAIALAGRAVGCGWVQVDRRKRHLTGAGAVVAWFYDFALAATMLAARSAMTRVGASVLPVVMLGITEASAIL